MKEFRFTAFTPTYNRSATLHRVHNSLKNQTFRNFEWLIVDDGSTDDTADIVRRWQSESDLEIRYIWQPNGHKKVAFNRGVREARGEFFIVFDSDDEAVPEALQTFDQIIQDIPEGRREQISGVVVLCYDEAGRIIGDPFPVNGMESTLQAIIYRHHVKGEKWDCHRTDVLRKFPFPEDIVGLVPESTLWYRIGHQYRTLFYNIPLRIYCDSSDGLVALGRANQSGRAEGRLLFAKQVLDHELRWILWAPGIFLKEALAFSLFGRFVSSNRKYERFRLTSRTARSLVWIVKPVAWLRIWLDT